MTYTIHDKFGDLENTRFWGAALSTRIAKSASVLELGAVLVMNEAEIKRARKERPEEFALVRRKVEQKLASLVA